MSEVPRSLEKSDENAAKLLVHASRLAVSLSEGRLKMPDGGFVSVRRNITETGEEVVLSAREKHENFTNLAFFIVNVTEPNLQVARFGMQRENAFLESGDFTGLAQYHEEIFRDALEMRHDGDDHDLDGAISLMRSAGAKVDYTYSE